MFALNSPNPYQLWLMPDRPQISDVKSLLDFGTKKLGDWEEFGDQLRWILSFVCGSFAPLDQLSSFLELFVCEMEMNEVEVQRFICLDIIG